MFCCVKPMIVPDGEVIDERSLNPDDDMELGPWKAKFIAALQEEYVQKKGGAVGKFFDTPGVPGSVVRTLEPLEDDIRSSSDPKTAIEQLSVKLGVRAAGTPGWGQQKVIVQPPNPNDPAFMQTAAPSGTSWGQ